MATEPLQCKILVLRVSIHCEGCKKKVKRVLQSVDGVYRCDIDARSNKVTVAVTGDVSADALVKRLRRSGKNAEQWPEQQQQPADSTQTPGETKKQATEPDRPGDSGTAEKPASGDAETSAAEQSNSRTSPEDPKKLASETAQPALDGTESTNADADGAVEHATNEATAEQCSDPKRTTRKQQHPEEEEKHADAMVLVPAASAQSSHACHLPPPLQHQQPPQPPVHVLSYSVARPSASAASYYAAAPAASAPPPQEPPYAYPPPCCYYPLPSPYHGSWAPLPGAASPARDSYSDIFSDDNANSCVVM
uniref:Uncharacterized protein n=1 Tax=Avena sativa TaxID=4498 RepID=A0ACD5U2J6_AVESA